jgi:hypothetical protein
MAPQLGPQPTRVGHTLHSAHVGDGPGVSHHPISSTDATAVDETQSGGAPPDNADIRRGAFKSIAELRAAITEYLDKHNADPKPFVWIKSAGEILEKVARAKQALESQH